MRGSVLIHGLVLSVLIIAGASGASAGWPLHEAAAKGDLQRIDELIASGIEVNSLKWGTATALSYAAKKGQLDAVRHLVEVHGADVNSSVGDSSSPIWTATNYGQIDIAEYLVRKGADIDLSVSYGRRGSKTAVMRDLRKNWPWDRWSEETYTEGARLARRERQALEQQEERERLEKMQARWRRDEALPAEVRRDKYRLALRKKMETGDYEGALIYFDFLRRLDLPMDSTFDLDHGEILLKTGDTEGALDKLYAYVQDHGAGDEHYMRALNLINSAEGR